MLNTYLANRCVRVALSDPLQDPRPQVEQMVRLRRAVNPDPNGTPLDPNGPGIIRQGRAHDFPPAEKEVMVLHPSKEAILLKKDREDLPDNSRTSTRSGRSAMFRCAVSALCFSHLLWLSCRSPPAGTGSSSGRRNGITRQSCSSVPLPAGRNTPAWVELLKAISISSDSMVRSISIR